MDEDAYEDVFFAKHGHTCDVPCSQLCPAVKKVTKSRHDLLIEELNLTLKSEKVQVRDDLL